MARSRTQIEANMVANLGAKSPPQERPRPDIYRSLGLVGLGFILGVVSLLTWGWVSPTNGVSGVSAVPAIGGVFFKVRDPVAYKEWYQEHFRIPFHETEGHFNACWRDALTGEMGRTVWGPFSDETTYFDPGTREYMHNFRVADLDAWLQRLRSEGVEVLDEVVEYDYGRFAWIVDIEGNRVELWEPAEESYDWDSACTR